MGEEGAWGRKGGGGGRKVGGVGREGATGERMFREGVGEGKKEEGQVGEGGGIRRELREESWGRRE